MLVAFARLLTQYFEDFSPKTMWGSISFGYSITEGRQKACVVSSDQGALGGATYVEIKRKPVLSLPGIEIIKTPSSQRLYYGRFGDEKGMVVIWEDENQIRINGESYAVTWGEIR